MLMATETSLLSIDPWLEPYETEIVARQAMITARRRKFLQDTALEASGLGHLYFGLHRTETGWTLREWAPNASAIYLHCATNHWQDQPEYAFRQLPRGEWQLDIPAAALWHLATYKLHVIWPGGDGHRIPAYARYVVQDTLTRDFQAAVWQPDQEYRWQTPPFRRPDESPLIYEAHIGMASHHKKVASYREFTKQVLPRIQAAGYNTVQLMAIAEHPYYGSFGYHVSNYFAPSSRFGTPDDLKALIDTAHQMGLAVIMDVVHSHAVKNEAEGLSRFDGSLHQYFHAGERGQHEAWDSRTFDYGKPEVINFLLSNCRYWLEEFRFDGFRFDGVTSMLYSHHGLGKAFTRYDDYFGSDVDIDALTYLSLASDVVHTLSPTALLIAEDMSAMPGLVLPTQFGGIGFDYRMSMGVPDVWIKTLKEKKDEDWDLEQLFHELTTHRPEEKVISYAESHDQALVGDKTLIFRLMDEAMYWHMQLDDHDLVVERGIALHKLIRLLTASTHGGGYLNFMGNEFGHPEWIDFPREGNNWSYQYARRQWQLVDDANLKYQWLAAFDKAMIQLLRNLSDAFFTYVTIHNHDGVLAYQRGGYLFVYNLSPTQSYTDYGLAAPAGDWQVVLSSDAAQFGGQDRIDTTLNYPAVDEQLKLYLPARTALVLQLRG